MRSHDFIYGDECRKRVRVKLPIKQTIQLLTCLYIDELSHSVFSRTSITQNKDTGD